jgi:hypothetical protein
MGYDSAEKKAKYRKGLAKDKAAIYEAGLKTRPEYKFFEPSDPPTDNTRGEFLTGPLKGGESLLYMRAKRAALKKAKDKKKK